MQWKHTTCTDTCTRTCTTIPSTSPILAIPFCSVHLHEVSTTSLTTSSKGEDGDRHSHLGSFMTMIDCAVRIPAFSKSAWFTHDPCIRYTCSMTERTGDSLQSVASFPIVATCMNSHGLRTASWGSHRVNTTWYDRPTPLHGVEVLLSPHKHDPTKKNTTHHGYCERKKERTKFALLRTQ